MVYGSLMKYVKYSIIVSNATIVSSVACARSQYKEIHLRGRSIHTLESILFTE